MYFNIFQSQLHEYSSELHIYDAIIYGSPRVWAISEVFTSWDNKFLTIYEHGGWEYQFLLQMVFEVVRASEKSAATRTKIPH